MRSLDSEVTKKAATSSFDSEIGEAARWLAGPRFEGITRLQSARQVVEQRSAWLERTGGMRVIEESAKAFQQAAGSSVEALLEHVEAWYLEAWQSEANRKSYPQAVADVIEFRASEGERFDMSAGEWLAFANRTSGQGEKM